MHLRDAMPTTPINAICHCFYLFRSQIIIELYAHHNNAYNHFIRLFSFSLSIDIYTKNHKINTRWKNNSDDKFASLINKTKAFAVDTCSSVKCG